MLAAGLPAQPLLPLERRPLRRALLLAPALAAETACEAGRRPPSPAPPRLWLAVPPQDSTRKGSAEALATETACEAGRRPPSPAPPGLWLAVTPRDSTRKGSAEPDTESDSTVVPTPCELSPLEDSDDVGDWGVGGARAPPPETLAAQGARRDDGEMLPVPPGLAPPPGAPSHGSTLHALGRCRPCNWFWKPSGCHFATECSCCHLCPAGEHKLRRRAKRALIRSCPRGGEPPAAPGAHPQRG